MTQKEKPSPRRLVQRFYSERYLLLTLLSFVLSVTATRIFLEITGYPQLGRGEMHFAHVLWGGIIWFAGSLFPLVFANRRALDISAILTGIGSGLFIDEIGKFITSSNDYFYPAAAPIIYSFFLITLFIFTITKKEKDFTLREHLYRVLEQFEEVLENDLSKQESDQMLADLSDSIHSDDPPELKRLAVSLKQIIKEEDHRLIDDQPDFLEKMDRWWGKVNKKLFPENGRAVWLFYFWLVLGLLSILHPIASLFSARLKYTLPGVWNELVKINLEPELGIGLVERLRLAGEAVIGVFLVLSAAAGFLGKKKAAATAAYIALLMLIVIINLLVFYFDQFSAIFFTSIQFLVFFLTRQYRLRLESINADG